MSNLGLYQWMTKTAKKVGGPVQFMSIIGGCGITIGAAGTKIFDAYKDKREKKNIMEKQYTVSTEMVSDDLVMKKGDQFKVLERTKHGILIEKVDDGNNPYFVDTSLLRKCSDFQ